PRLGCDIREILDAPARSHQKAGRSPRRAGARRPANSSARLTLREGAMPHELPEKYLLHVYQQIDIDAPLAVAFESMLEQLGPANETPHGPMPMKLEAWPGGRWFRDLSNN